VVEEFQPRDGTFYFEIKRKRNKQCAIGLQRDLSWPLILLSSSSRVAVFSEMSIHIIVFFVKWLPMNTSHPLLEVYGQVDRPRGKNPASVNFGNLGSCRLLSHLKGHGLVLSGNFL
jgi:hypothetical protein